MDTLQRFPLVWCPTCEKTQKMIFDVLTSGGKNDHEAADIVCDHCKSIIATLHAPRAQQASARPKRAAKAREMAGQAVDRLSDPSATDEERQTRKRRLLKGPKEFRDIRDKRTKPKR
jgi:phage terminase large subunit GpA-like protein